MVVGTAPCSGLLRRLRLDACPVAASALQRRHQQSTTSPFAAGQQAHKHAALFACPAVRPGHAASSSGSSGHPRVSGSPKQHGGSLLRHVASVSVPQTSTSQVLLPGTAHRVRPAGQAPPPSLLDSVNRHAAAAAGAGSRTKLRVAVDVDEVLGRFVYTLNQFCKDTYDMDYDVSDYWVYEFAKIWGCSQEHSNHIVHEFFQSQHFNDGIPVIPGAYEALLRLSETMELVVVTSRQHVIQDVTLEWLDRHYQGVFEEVYFGNHFALSGTSRKKSDICKTIGARVLIDDNPSYALECAAAGIHVLLYDWQLGYPWSKLNNSDLGPKSDLITVVRSWDDVEVALAALAPRLLAAPARARSSER